MQLEELFDYKNKIMKELCTNEKIFKLIIDNDNNVNPNYSLAYKHIFPYEYIPETVDDAQTFICFDVDITEVQNKTFYMPVLYFWIFTHKSKMRLKEGGIRIDTLCSEIDCVFNGNRNFGLGEMNLHSVERFSPILDYQGRVLTYYAKDFNRPRPTYKNPPHNRKSS